MGSILPPQLKNLSSTCYMIWSLIIAYWRLLDPGGGSSLPLLQLCRFECQQAFNFMRLLGLHAFQLAFHDHAMNVHA